MHIGFTSHFCAVCERQTIHALREGDGVFAKICLVCTKKHEAEQQESENE